MPKVVKRVKHPEFQGVLYTIPEQQYLRYVDPVAGVHHELWRHYPAPSFKHTTKPTGGIIYLNTNISLRRLSMSVDAGSNKLKTLGPECSLACHTVVCDGWIEEKHLDNGEVHFLRVLFVTDRPVETATCEMKFPKVADDQMRAGDIRIPLTEHIVRFVPIEVKVEEKYA